MSVNPDRIDETTLVVGLPELARHLGLSRETVRQALLRDEIPHARIGRKYLVARDVLDDLIHGRPPMPGAK